MGRADGDSEPDRAFMPVRRDHCSDQGIFQDRFQPVKNHIVQPGRLSPGFFAEKVAYNFLKIERK